MSDADQYFDNWTRTIIERDAWKKRALEAEKEVSYWREKYLEAAVHWESPQ